MKISVELYELLHMLLYIFMFFYIPALSITFRIF